MLGEFIGEVQTEWWTTDPRTMRLLADFSFVDPRGKVWTAPAGSITDGASIPRMLWPLAGDPFSGRYRRAAVIHDAYCPSNEPARDVHRMFYEAMLADGVEPNLALNFYLAVRTFGPKWEQTPVLGLLTIEPAPSFEQVERALDLTELAIGR